MKTQPQGFFLSRFTERSGVDGLVLLVIILVYLFQMNPNPGFHDSLGFLSDAVEGFHFETNATNHFLYNNGMRVLVLGLPFFSPVLLLGLVSVAFSTLTVLRIYELFKVLGKSQTVSLSCAGIFAFSFTWWQQTETIEVYALYGFLFSSILRYSIEDWVNGNRKNHLTVSVYLAFAFLTHIQTLLVIPYFLVYLFSSKELSMQRKMAALGLGLSGFVFLFVPVAFGLNSASSVFVESRFESNVGGFEISQIGKGLALAGGFFLYNFHVFAIFILHGLILLWKTERKILFQLALLFLPFFAFGVKFNVPDSHVFFIAAWLVLLYPLALSLSHWFGKAPSFVSVVLVSSLVITPLFYYSAWKAGEKAEALQEYAVQKSYKGGVAHLLWPGKRNAPDPLSLAKEICKPGPCPEVEWNAEGAVKYLKLIGAWETPAE